MTDLIVSVSDLKARLSEHLRHVKSGQHLIVTERGRPIATMRPLSHVEQQPQMQRLVQAGLVRAPTAEQTENLWDKDLPDDPTAGVRAELVRERRESR